MMKTQDKATARPNNYKEYYLEWVNNFLTIEKFAEYYGFSIKTATRIIETGKRLYDAR